MNTDAYRLEETNDLCASVPHLWLNSSSRLIIVLYGAVLLGIGLGSRTLTQHEVFAAYPAKEMLHYGHWIVQMFAGMPRTAKPPTTGWFIAACMKITGSDAEWVARIPSVWAGIITALLIASFAGRFFGNAIGLVTGLIQLTCFYTIMQARLAEADMLVCAAVAASFVCFGMGVLHGRGASATMRWGLAIGFYFFAGLAFLLKAVPIIFILLGVLTYAIVRRERHIFLFLLNPIGLIVLVGMIVGWPLAAYLHYPPIIESWKFELFGTASGKLGRDPIYTYLLSIPSVLMPWTPLILIGGWTWHKGLVRNRPLAQFLLSWFLPGVIFLHFSAFKHKHYPIPMLPPLSIIGAIGLFSLFRALKVPRPNPLLITIFTVILLIVGIVDGYVIPHRFDDYRPQKELALAANQLVPPSATIYIIDPEPKVEPQIAYYLRPRIWRYPTPSSFIAFAQGPLAQRQNLFVVTTIGELPDLQQIAQAKILAQASAIRKHETPQQRLVIVELSPKL